MGPKNFFPDILIIGAMKAGTTTLYTDITLSSEIEYSKVKEPHFLLKNDLGKGKMHRLYQGIYNNSSNFLIDASTGYAKFPIIPEVPASAQKYLGSDVKILYIIRHPVERMISHYQHNVRIGKEKRNINEAIQKNPEYIQISKYGMQIQEWLNFYDKQNIKIIIFEEYVQYRSQKLREVLQFLGLKNINIDDDQLRTSFNTLQNNPKIGSGVGRIIYKLTWTKFYKSFLNNIFSSRQKKWLKNALYRKNNVSVDSEIDPSLKLELKVIFNEDLNLLQKCFKNVNPTWDI